MTNRTEGTPPSGCITFEAAALGIEPKVLEKGREYIQNLISIGYAKPIYETDTSVKITDVDEQRFPGETTTTYKQKSSSPQRLIGCLLPDRDTESVTIIDRSTLYFGIFKFKDYGGIHKVSENKYFEPNINIDIGCLKSDLVSYFKEDINFSTIATSSENPDVVINKINELIPKIRERNELYRQNLNSVVRGFNGAMSDLFGSQQE